MPRGLRPLASSQPPTVVFQPPTSKLVENPGRYIIVNYKKMVTIKSVLPRIDSNFEFNSLNSKLGCNGGMVF